MASSKQDVQLILEGLVSMASRGLQTINLQENFCLIREIGDGGFGSVLLVNEKKTGHTMALKLLGKKKTTEYSFLMEFSMSFFLSSHPNIITSYGIAFKTDDHFGYTQELATHGDIFSLITDDGLPEDTVKRCAVQISSALDFMDTKGLVHLDIKPENILVFDKECHCIKITDFGFSQVKGTIAKKRSGTKGYMAPEMRQLTDKDNLLIDPSLDVWSFGVVVFCLLTGESPWQTALPTDRQFSHFVEWQNNTESVEPPSPWRRLPPQILKMFGGLLAIDSNRRSKSTEVLIFLDDCWKSEILEETEGILDDVDSQDSLNFQGTSTSIPEDFSCSSISTASLLRTLSYCLTSDNSHGEEHLDLQYPSLFMDDEVSVHVGAEVEIG